MYIYKDAPVVIALVVGDFHIILIENKTRNVQPTFWWKQRDVLVMSVSDILF